MINQKISFTDLFELDEIQRLQDEFSQATGVASVITTPEGIPLTKPSNFRHFCRDIIRKNKKGALNCAKSDSIIGVPRSDGPTIQQCLSAGLWDAGAGITVDGNHIANWLIGQVRDVNYSETKVVEYAKEIGVDEAVLLKAYREVPAMSIEKFKSISSMLYTLANQISSTAYQNVQQNHLIKELKETETTLREKQQELQDSEQRLSLVVNNLPSVVLYQLETPLTGETRFTYVSENILELHGVSADSVLLDPNTLYDQVHPEDIAGVLKAEKIAAQNMSMFRHEARFVLPNGVIKWIHITASPRLSDQGDIVWDGLEMDVTERKNAENKLIEVKKLLHETERTAQIGGWMLDIETEELSWTEEVFRIHEVDFSFVPNVKLAIDFYEPSDRVVIQRAVKSVIEREEPFDLELKIITATGQKKWIHAIGKALSDDGVVKKVSGSIQDITIRKTAEEKLKVATLNLDEVVRAARVGLWSWDLASNVVTFSEEWKRQIGYADHEITDNFYEWENRVHPKDLPSTKAAVELSIKNINQDHRVEFRFRHRDGSYRWILSQASFVFNEDGLVSKMLGSHIDITEQKKLESDLHQSQKLQSIGTLAGGVAHEFNNVLAIIMGNNELLMEDLPEGSLGRENIDEIRIAGMRATEVVKQLLTFSRQDSAVKDIIDLKATVEESMKLIGSSIPVNIKIEQNTAAGEYPFMGNATQITQILINLCNNAVDALPEMGGGVKIDLSTETIDILQLEYQTKLQSGQYAKLMVRDNGMGMNSAVLNKIFEPYFTTKGVGEGTGIGMAVVYGIVERHGGEIIVDSELGQGTTFTVYLPIYEDPVERKNKEVDLQLTGDEPISPCCAKGGIA